MRNQFTADNEMAERLKAALPDWSVSTFVHPDGQHGVSLFVPGGAVHRVLITLDETVQLTNRGCSEKEFQQAMSAVVANTILEVEVIMATEA